MEQGNGHSKDERVVYGANCTWWEDIHKVGRRGSIPACPHCGGVLFEMENIRQWNGAVEKHDAEKPGYKDFIAWLRGKCFRNYKDAIEVYNKDKGTNFKLG
jgi:hypothetical protein